MGFLNLFQKQTPSKITAKDIVNLTITYMRNNNYDKIIKLYKADAKPNDSASIAYDSDGILKDVRAINQYRINGHDTNRELSICIVSIMFHKSFRDTKEILKEIGYEDITDSEIYDSKSFVHSIKSIYEYADIGVKKYQIRSCGDSKICKTCAKMDKKIYPISKAVPGKTMPPFCNQCRCITIAVFK